MKYHVEIPTNMCAEILIDGRENEVEAGVYGVGKLNHLISVPEEAKQALNEWRKC
ncbi:MAG: hypothetical protein ACLVB1_03445 [Blautia obeum]